MRCRHGNRARFGGALLAAVGALALLALPSAAAAKDHNHDRIPDRWEKRHHLSLKIKQTARDKDRDHLRNRAEFLAGDDPRDRDSDDDGVMDGDENAGTIASFDPATGRLVINLFGGDTISGLVTKGTEIECDGVATNSDHGEDEPDGDDNRGHEPGDDHDGHDNSGPGNEDDDANCTTADLVRGAVVEEAELELRNGNATFEEVELAG
jgi:hypothetical protein